MLAGLLAKAGLGVITGKNGLPIIMGIALTVMTGLYFSKVSAFNDLEQDARQKIAIAQTNTEKVENLLITSETSLADIRERQSKDAATLAVQSFEMAALRKDLHDAEQKYKSYQKRWTNVATKKPELLARIINRATTARVRRIAELTCGENCPGDKDSEPDQ